MIDIQILQASKQLQSRIYGDDIAVVMDCGKKKVVVLQGDAMKAWKAICEDGSSAAVPPEQIKQLEALGLLEDNTRGYIPANDKKNSLEQYQPDNLELGVLNYWAFKNQIPISGHFELTGQCNLRCDHCYCTFEQSRDSLSTKQVCSIIDDLYDNGTFGLVLTGGEIFTRNDIMDILAYLEQKQFVLRINTNGTLLNEKRIQTLAEMSNIYRVHVSLYSPEPVVHDSIVHAVGAYGKTLDAIKGMKAAGIDVRINCSLMKSNYSSYKRLKTEIADSLGIPVEFDPMIFPKDDGSTANLDCQLDDEQYKEFCDYKLSILGRKKPKKRKLCKAGFSFFSICENGDIYPCLKMKRFYKNPLGNLIQQNFSDIWTRSREIGCIRATLNEKLRDCDVCEVTI